MRRVGWKSGSDRSSRSWMVDDNPSLSSLSPIAGSRIGEAASVDCRWPARRRQPRLCARLPTSYADLGDYLRYLRLDFRAAGLLRPGGGFCHHRALPIGTVPDPACPGPDLRRDVVPHGSAVNCNAFAIVDFPWWIPSP